MPSLVNFALSFFRPAPRETPTGWCERQIVIPLGPLAGSRFRVRNAPYMAFILDAAANPRVRKITLQWATQLGKTTLLLLILAYAVKHKPATALFVTDTATSAKSVSKNQFQPVIAGASDLADLCPTERIDERIQNLEQSFPNGALNYWVGANSSNALSGKSIRLLLCDEIRAYPEEIVGESGALELALNRVKSYRDHLIVLASTPTLPGRGVSQHHSQGSQHVFEVSCPHCATYQELKFEGLRWEGKTEKGWNLAAVKKSAHFRCVQCSGRMEEGDKTRLLMAGRWRQTNPAAPEEELSFHLSSFYSISLTWGEMAVKFLQSHGSINGRRDWEQNYKGLPWLDLSDTSSVTDADDFIRLEKHYQRGQNPIPAGGVVLMAVDVQASTLKFVIRAFTDSESFLIDHGECVEWSEIDERANAYGVKNAAIDTGHRAREGVYEAIIASGFRYLAFKGGQVSGMVRRSHIDPHRGKVNQGRVLLPLYHIDDHGWQLELDSKLAGGKGWYVYENVDHRYVRELLAERLVESVNRKTGKSTWEFQKFATNDYRDCEKYLTALHQIVKQADIRAETKEKAKPRFSDASLGGERL